MSHKSIHEFIEERDALNDLVLDKANLEIKRFFSLDDQAYRDGALDGRAKEMLGLVASLVLRCDDCVFYHLCRCHELGVGDAELQEALAIGLVVGGSIVIPHLRRAVRAWEELKGSDS